MDENVLAFIRLDPIEPISNLFQGFAGSLNRTGILPFQAGASLLEAVLYQEKIFRRLIRAVVLLGEVAKT